MGENEIDWDETELIHVAACALALGGGFFDSINPDVVANRAVEVAKLIIAKARLDSRGKASGVLTHLSTCRFYDFNSTNIYKTCDYCDQEINGGKLGVSGGPATGNGEQRNAPAFYSASEAHAAGIPVLGAAGAFGGVCKKSPMSNTDSSLVVACGLPNGHERAVPLHAPDRSSRSRLS